MNRVFFRNFLVILLLAVSTSSWAGKITNIDNAELQALLKQGVTLVDIRRVEEWAQTGVVKGAHKITLFDSRGRVVPSFLGKFQKVAKPNQPVILICRTGSRTKVASRLLTEQAGYTKVYNVTKGIYGWLDEKLPVEK